ncbi:MAG: hypothetical protein ACFN4H_07650, partial [Prevotella sp.]
GISPVIPLLCPAPPVTAYRQLDDGRRTLVWRPSYDACGDRRKPVRRPPSHDNYNKKTEPDKR